MTGMITEPVCLWYSHHWQCRSLEFCRGGLRITCDRRWFSSPMALGITITLYMSASSHLHYGRCNGHQWAHTSYQLHLGRIRVDVHDTYDSHLGILPMAVPIPFAFFTPCWSFLHYRWLGVSAIGSEGQQLPLRMSHRCNRGAAIDIHVEAPNGKYGFFRLIHSV